MARKSRVVPVEGEVDQPAAAAGDAADATGHTVEHVFDEPYDAQKAVDALLELNHERVRCLQAWEEAKAEAADAKKALDDATSAITMFIDRIDAQQRGELTGQPALRTVQ